MFPLLLRGQWRAAEAAGSFTAVNPADGSPVEGSYPTSTWGDCEAALDAAHCAFAEESGWEKASVATFLEDFASRIEAGAKPLCEMAASETGLPVEPRLQGVELPRTTGQLRKAAAAARTESWRDPVTDPENGLATCRGPLGPVLVMGPNNFPLAFNPIAGGDFAAAIAAGNPVIAKAHPAHPGVTRLLAEHAASAADEAGLPAGAVQLLYGVTPEDGLRMVGDPRVAALAFTGSQRSGLKLKAAADAAGKPAYLEMAGSNPVFLLPGAIAEKGPALVEEVAGSCLLASGQFCTGPKLLVLQDGAAGEQFLAGLTDAFSSREPGVLLADSVAVGLAETVAAMVQAGAGLLVGGERDPRPGFRFRPTILRVSGEQFVESAEALQADLFGPATLVVQASDGEQLFAVADRLQGTLTASVYSAAGGSEDGAAGQLMRRLRRKAGRVINDAMPTGVAVSPAMNHGGPFPATGHPGFSAVGVPVAIRRFTKLDCYDRVRPHRLPDCLQNA